MKKRIGILLVMAIFMGIPFVAAKAAESEPSGTDEKSIKSYGTIVYEDANGSVKICAEDIVLLQEKLSSIPEEIFDPALYSNTHVLEEPVTGTKEAAEIRKESTVDVLNADMPVQEAEEKPQAETEETEEKPEAPDMEPQPQIPEIIETISGNDCVDSKGQEVPANVVTIEEEGADH